MNPNIFRAYDIRGVYGKDITEENTKLIGRAFGTYLGGNCNIVVGRDNRTHGEILQNAFIKGLINTGCNVTNIGLSPSPLLYFANTIGNFDAGCNITASHNPPEDNGFKFIGKNAHAIYGDELKTILDIIQKESFIAGVGSLQKKSYFDEYKKRLCNMFHFEKKLKIVIDTGNGVSGKYYPEILKACGHEVIELFTELDGTFPNHQPDPIVEKNLKSLQEKIKETSADIGMAFDGDGDRIGIVDENGIFYNSDKILILLSRDILTRHPGSKIVFTVSNSQLLFSDIQEHGGEPIMCKVGHSYVENTMSENNALLGGEQSGHFFLKEDYYPFDDAIVAALRILKIHSDNEKPFSMLFETIPKILSEPEIRPYIDDTIKFEVIEKIKKYFSDHFSINTLDGIRIDFGDNGWAGIRASNTSPRISICMEAETEEKLELIKKTIFDHLNTYPEIEWGK